jgi:aminopeptidase N
VDSAFRVLADVKLEAPRSWLVAALQGDPAVVGRIRAARALAREGSPQAVVALVAALAADGFWGVRAEIADLLGERGGEVEARALVAALEDPHPKVRRRVVTALGGVRRPEVGEALAARTGDASVQVEAEVVKSLGRLRHPTARARAEAVLQRDAWADVYRSRAAEALGALRDPAVLDTLVAATGEDRPARARAAACAALAKLGDEVESTRTAVVERLLPLAEDPNFRVQVAAINGLGTLRDPRALPVLERVHGAAGDGRCRRLAWEAMQNVHDGRTGADGLTALRSQVEELAGENRKLRDRVVRLEGREV